MSGDEIRGGSFRATLEHARVEDVMHPGIFSCPPETDLRTVARIMATHHIHAVVVSGVGRTAGGERLTWGLLSSLDLIDAALSSVPSADAGDLASTEIVTVAAAEPLEDAARLMVERRLRHLVVISPTAQPIGIVSTLDVAGCLARREA